MDRENGSQYHREFLNGFTLPKVDGISRHINSSSREYETNFKTLLKTNTMKRFALFYHFLRGLDQKKANEFVQKLFGEHSEKGRDEIWDVNFDNGLTTRTVSLLEQVRMTPFMMIPHLLTINDAIRQEQARLQRDGKAVPKRLRTFVVVPRTKEGRHHLNIDTESLLTIRSEM